MSRESGVEAMIVLSPSKQMDELIAKHIASGGSFEAAFEVFLSGGTAQEEGTRRSEEAFRS